jgi:RNA polymerase sigma factor (sigma-70 family)
MKGSPDEDRLLLSLCFSGDEKAKEDLVRRFSNLIYQAAQHTLRLKFVPYTRHDLEDLHNTIFLQLFDQGCKKLKQYQGKNGCSLATWIRLVAVRIVLDHLRKKDVYAPTRQGMRIPLDEMLSLKGDQTDALGMLERAEKERLLRDAIQSLPARDRLFTKLHVDKGLPVEKVAATMQLSVNNAYVIKHRLIERLKAQVVSELSR